MASVFFFAGFVLLLGIVLATSAVLGTQTGLQWLAQRVPNLQADNLQGNVLQGFSVQRLQWQGESAEGKPMAVEVSGLVFKIDWFALGGRKLLIENIQAQDVSLDIPPGDDSTLVVLPDSIDLPIDIEVKRLHVDSLRFNAIRLNGIEATVSTRDGAMHLQNLAAWVEDTRVQAHAQLQLKKPYAMDGQVNANREFDSLSMAAVLGVGGTLERLVLDLTANGTDTGAKRVTQAASLHAVVMPFSVAFIEEVDLKARQFNPQDWFAMAPKAALNVQAKAKPNADFSQTSGALSVTNTLPLSLQGGGIPVSRLELDFMLELHEKMLQSISMRVPILQFASGNQKAGSSQLELTWQTLVEKDDQGGLAHQLMRGDLDFALSLLQVRPLVFVDLPSAITLDGAVRGSKVGDLIELSEFSIKDRAAQLQGRLNVDMGRSWPVDVQLSLRKLNPALYVNKASIYMQGQLNGSAGFKGTLKDSGPLAPAGELLIDLHDSSIAKAPVVLNARALVGVRSIESLALNLDVLGNTVKAQGRYGKPGDALLVNASLGRLPELGQLIQRKLAGSVLLNATVSGQGAQVSAQGDVNVTGLLVDDLLAVKSAKGQFNLGSMPDSPWQADLALSSIAQPGGQSADWIKTMGLQLRGTRSQHSLQVQADTGFTPFSRQRPIKASLQLTGGVQALDRPGKPLGWKGFVQALKIDGMWAPARGLTLQAPAALAWGPRYIELRDFSLRGEDSTEINNRLLRIAGSDVRIEGDVPAITVPRLSPILRTQVSVEPQDLVAKINWRYRATPREVDGHVDVSHVSGGLQVLEDSQIEVPIQTFKADLDFNRNNAALDLVVNAADFGRVTANLRLPVQQNKLTKAWGLAGDAPMLGSVGASFERLNWLGPMISGGVRTTGTAQVAVAIGGSLNKPDVQGRLFAMDMDVFQLDQGIRLEDGNVVVDFTADQAKIDTFDFTVYNRQTPRRRIEELGPLIQGNGKLTASGQWNLAGLNGGLSVNLDRAPIVQRSDRWAMVSSTLLIQQPTVEGQALKVRGEVNVHGAYVETPESGVPTLSDDVIVKGRTPASSAGMPLDVQLQANLGKLFYLNADGLRTRLEGGLRLVMVEGVGGSGQRKAGRRLSATGTIQTVDGTYRAYGQDLTIDRGVVNFQGPLENPGINVRAVRKGVAVEAGVEVTGTAQRPKVSLVSDPAVPDSEKLSWMIIGRGTNSADRDQTLLLTAAAAIFGDDDESPTRKIAKQIGIDDFSLSTGSLTAVDSRAVGSKVAIAPGADVSANSIGAEDPLLSQRIISVGKKISDKVYASFDQSVTTAASILKLNYQYSRQLSFIARTGADNAIDALYQISFD